MMQYIRYYRVYFAMSKRNNRVSIHLTFNNSQFNLKNYLL